MTARGHCRAGQCVLDYPLHGARVGLSLPPGETGTVVVEDELNRPLRHDAEVMTGGERVQYNSMRIESSERIDIAPSRLDIAPATGASSVAGRIARLSAFDLC